MLFIVSHFSLLENLLYSNRLLHIKGECCYLCCGLPVLFNTNTYSAVNYFLIHLLHNLENNGGHSVNLMNEINKIARKRCKKGKEGSYSQSLHCTRPLKMIQNQDGLAQCLLLSTHSFFMAPLKQIFMCCFAWCMLTNLLLSFGSIFTTDIIRTCRARDFYRSATDQRCSSLFSSRFLIYLHPHAFYVHLSGCIRNKIFPCVHRIQELHLTPSVRDNLADQLVVPVPVNVTSHFCLPLFRSVGNSCRLTAREQ